MLLRDALLLLPDETVADIYDTLYQPEEPEDLPPAENRALICKYWAYPQHWNELVVALSVPERQALTRIALGERYPIDPFLEQLSDLGLVMISRDHNRFFVPDDVREQLLERLPSLRDRIGAIDEEPGGTTGV